MRTDTKPENEVAAHAQEEIKAHWPIDELRCSQRFKEMNVCSRQAPPQKKTHERLMPRWFFGKLVQWVAS